VTTAIALRGGVTGLPAVACSIWVATSWMRLSVLSLPLVVGQFFDDVGKFDVHLLRRHGTAHQDGASD
jgi:hypothetical protein